MKLRSNIAVEFLAFLMVLVLVIVTKTVFLFFGMVPILISMHFSVNHFIASPLRVKVFGLFRKATYNKDEIGRISFESMSGKGKGTGGLWFVYISLKNGKVRSFRCNFITNDSVAGFTRYLIKEGYEVGVNYGNLLK